MARSNIPMVINLRQNTNDDSTAFGKWFAEVDSKEPLNLKGFAKHMTSHGKIADYQMCVLVLGQVVECMSELLAQGQPVKLDGLGTFSPSVDGQKQGKNDIESAVAAGADAMIKEADEQGLQRAVHLRVRVCGAERDPHDQWQAAPRAEEDADQLRAGTRGRRQRWRWKRVISSPPEFFAEQSGKAERGGVRGGLRSALPLATEGTQERGKMLACSDPLWLPLT